MPKVTIIDGVEYMKVADIPSAKPAKSLKGKPFVLVRTYSAGVFAGYLVKRDGMQVTLTKARRLWKWSGASECSQLAQEGVKNKADCKFPMETDVLLTQAIEIHTCTATAQESITSVPVWKS